MMPVFWGLEGRLSLFCCEFLLMGQRLNRAPALDLGAETPQFFGRSVILLHRPPSLLQNSNM